MDKTSFNNWSTEIIFRFLENELFQPIGLELTCTAIHIDDISSYEFSGIEKSDISKENYPLAYYNYNDNSIHVFVDHESFKNRPDKDEAYAFYLFLLYHEASHKLLMHQKRGEGKIHELWNIAADMEIHNMFYVFTEIIQSNPKYASSKIKPFIVNYIKNFLFQKTNELKSEGLFDKKYLQCTAEEIYNDLQNSNELNKTSYDFSSGEESGTITESTYELPNKKIVKSTSIKRKNEKDNNSENGNTSDFTKRTLLESTIKKEIVQAFGQEMGSLSSECAKFLNKLFKIKIDWEKILRSSLLTTLEKDDLLSWSRPRTSLFGLDNPPYLPGIIEDESSYGTLIVAVDESGSVPDDVIRKAASIIIDAKEYYSKIIVLKHDIKIKDSIEIEEINNNIIDKFLLNRKAYGGTSHKEVFEFINSYDNVHKDDEYAISCCIFITDLYSDVEETQQIARQKIPKIYLVNNSYNETAFKDIEGKIILI